MASYPSIFINPQPQVQSENNIIPPSTRAAAAVEDDELTIANKQESSDNLLRDISNLKSINNESELELKTSRKQKQEGVQEEVECEKTAHEEEEEWVYTSQQLINGLVDPSSEVICQCDLQLWFDVVYAILEDWETDSKIEQTPFPSLLVITQYYCAETGQDTKTELSCPDSWFYC